MAYAHKDAVTRRRAAQVCRPYEWRNPLGRAGEDTRPYGVSEGAFDLL